MYKKRLPQNKGLPERWRFTHGAYYYQVPPGLEALWDGKKTFRLGKTLPEAFKTYAQRAEIKEKTSNIGQLLDRYSIEVIPTKALKTQKENTTQITKLKKVFGDATLMAIKPKHIYQYFDKSPAKVLAKREIALLSHAFTKAVQWGYIDKHPFKREIRLEGEKARTRYVEDWEIDECLSLSAPQDRGGVAMVQAYIRIKLLTGLRRGDLLRLSESQFQEDGIHITTNKTGKPVIYQWTDELRSAIAHAKKVRPVDISPFLFCNKRGKSYLDENNEASGWDSLWQRFMARVLAETKITEKFREHDLRAKVASDAENLDRARALLSHTDSRTTNRIYRRKAEIVMPTK